MSSNLYYPIIDDIAGDEIYTISDTVDSKLEGSTSRKIKTFHVHDLPSVRAQNPVALPADSNYSNIYSSIIAYIDANLRDPELNTLQLTRRFNISRSHLYRIFKESGGVAKLIRRKRLEHACRIIQGRKHSRIFLKEIAYLCGFRNGTQFNKAFKDYYGYNVKELQQALGNDRNIPPAPVQNHAIGAPDRMSLQTEPSE